MSKHALLSPSGADRWIKCRGSLALEKSLPEEKPSEYLAEGSAAHTLAEMVLNSEAKQTSAFKGRSIEEDGFKFTVDDDMCRHVQSYVDLVLQCAGDNILLIEQKVDFSETIGQPDSFGTADAIILDAQNKELVLIDLKYGRKVEVFAEENEQLMLYALGALETYGLIFEFETVRLIISQPRIHNSVREWDCSLADLLLFAGKAKIAATSVIRIKEVFDSWLNPLENSRAEFVRQNPEFFTPGEKQCCFCKVRGFCPAAAEYITETVGAEMENLDQKELNNPPASADNNMLSKYMAKVDMIEYWCEAVRGAVLRELREGNEVPNYKLVQGKKGHRKWIDATEAEKLLKAMRLKHEERYKIKVISPTQAEKVLENSPKKWRKLQDQITQAEGNPSVAHASDRRQTLIIPPVEDEMEDLTKTDNII